MVPHHQVTALMLRGKEGIPVKSNFFCASSHLLFNYDHKQIPTETLADKSVVTSSCLWASLVHIIRKATETSPCASWMRKARERMEEGHDGSSCRFKFKCSHTTVVLPIACLLLCSHSAPPEKKTNGPWKGQFSIKSCHRASFWSALFVVTVLCLYHSCYHLSTSSQSSYICFSYFYFSCNFYKCWHILKVQNHVQLPGHLTVVP